MNKAAAEQLAGTLAKKAIEKRSGQVDGLLQSLRGLDMDSLKEWFMGMPPEARNAILGALIGGVGSSGLSAVTGGNIGSDALIGAVLGSLAGGGGTYAKRYLFDRSTPSAMAEMSSEQRKALREGLAQNDINLWPFIVGTGAGAGAGAGVGLGVNSGINRATAGVERLNQINDIASKYNYDELAASLRPKPSGRKGLGASGIYGGNPNKVWSQLRDAAVASEASREWNKMNAFQKWMTALTDKNIAKFEQRVNDAALRRMLRTGHDYKSSLGWLPKPNPRLRPPSVAEFDKFQKGFKGLKNVKPNKRYWPIVAGLIAGGALAGNALWPWE